MCKSNKDMPSNNVIKSGHMAELGSCAISCYCYCATVILHLLMLPI